METRASHIAQKVIQTGLMSFWIFVALDKLWEVNAFKMALLKQPIPEELVSVLFWGLPIFELFIGLLFISRYRKAAFFLSSALLILFSIYITLGLLDFYPKKPCGCASVFNSLSWEWHLVLNIVLLILSISGWYLNGPTNPMDPVNQRKSSYPLHIVSFLILCIPVICPDFAIKFRFPRKFALFPARPVAV